MSNITSVTFGSVTSVRTEHLWQYDYGQYYQFSDIDLPELAEVHFSNSDSGTAYVQIATDGLVAIPDDLLKTGQPVFAWIFLHTGDSDGETVYKVTTPVMRRAEPADIEPTPEQATAIQELIEAMQSTVDTVSPVAELLENAPTDGKTYELSVTAVDGAVTFSWIESNTLTR